MDAFYNDPRASAKAGAAQTSSSAVAKNLEAVWAQYRGSFPFFPVSFPFGQANPLSFPDPVNAEEVSIDGTMRYCEALDVNPEEIIMLALAHFTKAPTMGRFNRKGWIEAWQAVRFVSLLLFLPLPLLKLIFPPWSSTLLRADTIERQREQVSKLRAQLQDSDHFRRVYNFSFDYAKAEGQKSMRSSSQHRRRGMQALIFCPHRIRDRARAVEAPCAARSGIIVPTGASAMVA